jgi:multidrug efflux pump subunit AcrA (membrane-fusion protein)
VVPSADAGSRTFLVKADLPYTPSLRSGLFGRMDLPVGHQKRLVVPASALSVQADLTRVYVVDAAQRVRMRLITVGRRFGQDLEVLSGLKEGERIVVGELEKVRDGSEVIS